MKLKDAFKTSKVSYNIIKIFICLICSTLISINLRAYPELPLNENFVGVTDCAFKEIGSQQPPVRTVVILKLRKLLNADRLNESKIIADSVRLLIRQGVFSDSTEKAYAYYLTGVYDLKTGNNAQAISNLKESVYLYKKTGNSTDTIYSDALYNLGYAFSSIGDYGKSLQYFEASLTEEKLIKGDNSISLIISYSSLSTINLYLRNYEKALELVNLGLRIAQLYPGSVSPATMATLYGTKGVIFTYQADYEQAKGYLEKAETYYKRNNENDLNYINLLDNLGTVYHFLGAKERSYYYYEKGVKLLSNNISQIAFNLTKNYAIILANDSLAKKGDLLLSDFLDRVKLKPGTDLRFYFSIRRNYADYLCETRLNYVLAKELYLQCFRYLTTHPWDNDLRDNTILGYSLLMFRNDQNRIALDSLQTLLFAGKVTNIDSNPILNPGSVNADWRSLKILRLKYRILWNEYKKKDNLTFLKAAAETSEIIIDILEKIRLSIGEEGSRLLLGDRYRNSYIDAIMCLNECYIKTGNQNYLEKTFKYSEKSKVASLLASTREIRAMQNFIPPVLGNMEKNLQWNIGLYSSSLAEEEKKETPDIKKIALWKENIRIFSERRDSLINVFEKTYPDYYSIKYNSNVVGLNELPGIIGNRKNYLSYIVTDSLLYTFISNKRYRQLFVQRIDSSFFETVAMFRKILSTPDLDEKSLDEFRIFQHYGYKLYGYLIEPVKKYLISNNLIISPDNILSYLPFETFLTEETNSTDLLYNKLSYLTNEFNISYAYSATLLAENRKTNRSLKNKSIVFSPSYKVPINPDSISNARQASGRMLKDLPNAREEAEYVSGITHGLLYADSAATESNYKRIAGNYDIIHLAMHTYIDMHNPILSRLFFSGPYRPGEEYGMGAFEVYGIALRAKMVVLSSCNTGVGNLRRGEGILSLARGFIYSGSKSVVMSLWEVDDKSGTDIVKSFYNYLKKGYSKSESLRRARIMYLKNAHTVRSFPYFWSTLVIYGDDSPVYTRLATKLMAAAAMMILILATFIYFRKR
jgi:CHAT domain-containing protein